MGFAQARYATLPTEVMQHWDATSPDGTVLKPVEQQGQLYLQLVAVLRGAMTEGLYCRQCSFKDISQLSKFKVC